MKQYMIRVEVVECGCDEQGAHLATDGFVVFSRPKVNIGREKERILRLLTEKYKKVKKDDKK